MYFKITNETENHHGFQYKDGLNILDKEFDANPDNHRSICGLYFATLDHIHEFLDFGIYLRVIELPFGDSDFKMINYGTKFRANKIILKNRYLLSDIETHKKFNLDINSTFRWASSNGHLEVVKFLVEKGADIHADDNYAFCWASKNGHLEVVKFLVEKGADIHANNNVALRLASMNAQLEIIKFLVEKGVDIHADNEYALRFASYNGHLEVVKLLVEKGANIHAGNDDALRFAYINGYLEIVKFLEVVKFLVEKNANIHTYNDTLRWASGKWPLAT